VHVDNAIIGGLDTIGAWVTVKDRDHIPVAASIILAAFEYATTPIRLILYIDPGVPTQTEAWLSIGNRPMGP
jgi:hypothetical protein